MAQKAKAKSGKTVAGSQSPAGKDIETTNDTNQTNGTSPETNRIRVIGVIPGGKISSQFPVQIAALRSHVSDLRKSGDCRVAALLAMTFLSLKGQFTVGGCFDSRGRLFYI